MKKALVFPLVCLVVGWCGCTTSGTSKSTNTTTPQPVSSAGHPNAASLNELGRPWLEPDAALAVTEGASPVEVIAADVASDGDRVGAFFSVPTDQCVLVLARASRTIEDIDLIVFSEDGTPIAADEATDAQPGAMLCPPQSKRLYAAARVASGKGIVAVGIQKIPTDKAIAVGKILNVRGAPGAPVGRTEVWPGLEQKVSMERRRLGGTWKDLRRAAVPLDPQAPAVVSAEIRAGECISAFVTPAESVLRVDLDVVSEQGRILGHGNEIGRDRSSVVCSELATTVSFRVRSYVSSGIGALVLSRLKAGHQKEIAVNVDRIFAFPVKNLSERSQILANLLTKQGYSKQLAQTKGNALVGKRTSLSITLPKGCARVDVIGGTPLAGMVLDLWDDKGALLDHSEGGGEGTLFACTQGSKARIDVESLARPGPFGVEVRQEPSAPTTLAGAGIAAARLLSRFHDQHRVSSKQLENIAQITMDDQTLNTAPLALKAGECVEVAAAIGTQGRGVELRLVDAKNREQVDRSLGSFSSLVRTCAQKSDRLLQIELRLRVGKDTLVSALRRTK
jgi:hypothetical protein